MRELCAKSSEPVPSPRCMSDMTMSLVPWLTQRRKGANENTGVRDMDLIFVGVICFVFLDSGFRRYDGKLKRSILIGGQSLYATVNPVQYKFILTRLRVSQPPPIFNCARTVHAQLISKPVPAVWIISIFRCWLHQIAVYQAVYPVDYGALRYP